MDALVLFIIIGDTIDFVDISSYEKNCLMAAISGKPTETFSLYTTITQLIRLAHESPNSELWVADREVDVETLRKYATNHPTKLVAAVRENGERLRITHKQRSKAIC